jgi:hypothetical protein
VPEPDVLLTPEGKKQRCPTKLNADQAALAPLHNCREVTSQFWEMSEVVMAVSQATRRGVEAELGEAPVASRRPHWPHGGAVSADELACPQPLVEPAVGPPEHG